MTFIRIMAISYHKTGDKYYPNNLSRNIHITALVLLYFKTNLVKKKLQQDF
jgi:hypothetical protein